MPFKDSHKCDSTLEYFTLKHWKISFRYSFNTCDDLLELIFLVDLMSCFFPIDQEEAEE